jgi:YHS domain-containing protein
MKARYLLASTICAAVFAATLYAAEIDLKDVTCILNPKGPAKAETAVDYKGGKVFFCCQNCPKKFAEEPTKYAVKANHQLVLTKQAKQEKCPLTGNPLNPEQTVKVSNVEVTFCCPNCKGKVAAAEGDEQAELVFSDTAFAKAFKVPKAEDKE